jgi:hypothetical protein
MREIRNIKTIVIKPDRKDKEILERISAHTGIRNIPDIIRFALTNLMKDESKKEK